MSQCKKYLVVTSTDHDDRLSKNAYDILSDQYMNFRIVSYNLLVPKYGNQPEFYINSDPKFLETEYRWCQIQKQLSKEISLNQNTIVCLQELSHTLITEINQFFTGFDYKLHDCQYGNANSDYMGVGIAVPNTFQIDSVEKIVIGKELQAVLKRKKKKLNTFAKLFCCSRSNEGLSFNQIVNVAVNARNTLVIVKLQIANFQFCVGTYHMPCAYRLPDVMLLHASYVKDLMFSRSQGKPFILAGDFNITPSSDVYLHLTGKKSDAFNCLPADFPFTYASNSAHILSSAYANKNGTEPVYTNYVHCANLDTFCETLDYIFFSDDQLKVTDVLELPSQPTGDSYPDETNPSDHLMIAATFEIMSKRT